MSTAGAQHFRENLLPSARILVVCWETQTLNVQIKGINGVVAPAVNGFNILAKVCWQSDILYSFLRVVPFTLSFIYTGYA